MLSHENIKDTCYTLICLFEERKKIMYRIVDHDDDEESPGKMTLYSLSNGIMADEKFLSFHQYLRYSHTYGTIAFSTPSAII